MSERLVDAKVIAKRLAVPASWIREQTRSGALPCVELGRYRRYDIADVDAWLEDCNVLAGRSRFGASSRGG